MPVATTLASAIIFARTAVQDQRHLTALGVSLKHIRSMVNASVALNGTARSVSSILASAFVLVMAVMAQMQTSAMSALKILPATRTVSVSVNQSGLTTTV